MAKHIIEPIKKNFRDIVNSVARYSIKPVVEKQYQAEDKLKVKQKK